MTEKQAAALCNNAGVFPYPDKRMMFQFIDVMRDAMKDLSHEMQDMKYMLKRKL